MKYLHLTSVIIFIFLISLIIWISKENSRLKIEIESQNHQMQQLEKYLTKRKEMDKIFSMKEKLLNETPKEQLNDKDFQIDLHNKLMFDFTGMHSHDSTNSRKSIVE